MRLFKKVFTLANILIAGSTAISTSVLSSCSNSNLELFLKQDDFYISNGIIKMANDTEHREAEIKYNFPWKYDIDYKLGSSIKIETNYVNQLINPYPNVVNIYNPSTRELYYGSKSIVFYWNFWTHFNDKKISFELKEDFLIKIYIDRKLVRTMLIHLPPFWFYVNLNF